MKKLTTKQFIIKAHEKHGHKYSYGEACYLGIKKPVIITCPDHGNFEQTPSDHIHSGAGCPVCYNATKNKHLANTNETFISKARTKHGDKYDYSLINYINNRSMLSIICPSHGEFQQKANSHLNGYGCSKCGDERVSESKSLDISDVISRSAIIHNNKYDYSKSIYTKCSDKITIICPDHGEFHQRVDGHLQGHGCERCSYFVSKGEQQIVDMLTQNGVICEQSNRNLIYPNELDIFIPDHNIAIEFCGLYWHTEQMGKGRQYHRTKYTKCKKLGIRLITIFEDEWRLNKNLITKKLLHIFDKSTDMRVYARKCKIVNVDNNTKSEFFENHHIQGNGPSSINIGLEYEGELVACMGFIHQTSQHYLNRFATKYKVIGGFSKLLKHFQKNYQWQQIISFADCRWSSGDLYKVTGWVLDDTLPPDYAYISNNKRIHKFNYRHKYLPSLLTNYDPNKSEWENCKSNNIGRIWDCGKMRFVYHNPNNT